MKIVKSLFAVLLAMCVLASNMITLVASANGAVQTISATETGGTAHSSEVSSALSYNYYKPDYTSAGIESIETTFTQGSSRPPVIDENGNIYAEKFRGWLFDTNSPVVTDGIFEFTYNLSSAVNLEVLFRATDVNNYSSYEAQYNWGAGRNYISYKVDGVSQKSPELTKFVQEYGVDHKARLEVSGNYVKFVVDDNVIYEGESEFVGTGEGRFGLYVNGNGTGEDSAPNVTIKDVKISYPSNREIVTYKPDYTSAGIESIDTTFHQGSSKPPVIDENGNIYAEKFRGWLIDSNSPVVTDGIFEFTYNLSSAVNLAVMFRATDTGNYSAYEAQYNWGYGRNYISNTVEGVTTQSPELTRFIQEYGVDHKARLEVIGNYVKFVVDDNVIYEGESEFVGTGEGRFGIFVNGNGSGEASAPDVTIKDVKITYPSNRKMVTYEPDYKTLGVGALDTTFVKGSSIAPVIDENGNIYAEKFRGFLIDTNSPVTADGVFEFTYNLSSPVNLLIAFRAIDLYNHSAYDVAYNWGGGRNFISNVVDGVKTTSDEVAKKLHTYGEDHKVRFEVKGKYLKLIIDDEVIYEGESEFVGDGEGRFAIFVDGNGSSVDNAPDVTIKDIKITYFHEESSSVYDATSNLLANGDPYATDLVTEEVFKDAPDADAVMRGEATATVNKEVTDGERYDFTREFVMSTTEDKNWEYTINFPEALNLAAINGKGIIRFWMNTSAANKKIAIGLKDASNATRVVYVLTPVSDGWKEYQIPISVIGQNGLNKAQITALVIKYEESPKTPEYNFSSEDSFAIAGLSIYSNTAPRLLSDNVETVYFAEPVAGGDNFGVTADEVNVCSIYNDYDATFDGLGIWGIEIVKDVKNFALAIPPSNDYELSDFAPFGKITLALAADRYTSYSLRITDGEKIFTKDIEADKDWMTYSVAYYEISRAGVDTNNIKSIEIFRDKPLKKGAILYLSPIKIEADYSVSEFVYDGTLWTEKEVTYDKTTTITVPVEPQTPSDDKETNTTPDTKPNNDVVTKPVEKIDESVLSEKLIKLYIQNTEEDMILFSTDTPDVITAGVFKLLREANKGIRYQIVDADGSVIAFWDITNIAENAADMKMSVEFTSDDESAISAITKTAKNAYVKTAYNGKMPGDVMLYVSNTFDFDSKNSPKLYTYNGSALKTVDGVVVGLTGDEALIGIGLTEGGEYTLSSYRVKTVSNQQNNNNNNIEPEQNSNNIIIIIAVVLVALLVVVIVVIVVLKKKKSR